MKALSVESRVHPQLIYRLIFLLFGLYQGDLVDVEKDLANADEQFEEGESKDAATEAVLSSGDMSKLDGMLDTNKYCTITRSCFARHPSHVLASPAALRAFLLHMELSPLLRRRPSDRVPGRRRLCNGARVEIRTPAAHLSTRPPGGGGLTGLWPVKYILQLQVKLSHFQLPR
jgi:hypothetical protein